MDTITHTVLGACMGEAILGSRIGKKGMMWGALFANLPDVDIFYSSWQELPDNLLAHRGITHSILFSAVMIPLLAYIFYRWYSKQDIGFAKWFWLFFAALISHIFIDSLTNYGTGLLEPFSNIRISFNTIFVADPFFTISLLIAAILLLILRNKSKFRKPVYKLAFAISTAYILFTFANKASINSVFRKSLDVNNIVYTEYITEPTPLNNFLWYCVAKNENGFSIGYRSLFDADDNMQLFHINNQDSLLNKFRSDEAVKKLIRFSQEYYTVSKSDSDIIDFHDIRFGQLGFNSTAPFVFTFHLSKKENAKTLINQGRFSGVTSEAFRTLIERIKGE